MNCFKNFLLGASVLTCTGVIEADKPTISVFGNIGAVYHSSENIGYRSDISKSKGIYKNDFDFTQNSKLGLQVEYSLSPTVDFVAQGLLQKEDSYRLDNILKMAFLRYRATDSFSIRAGRTAFDMFLMSESRDIDFTHLWALPPQEVYSLLPTRYVDGVDLIGNFSIEQLALRTKLTFGETDFQLNAIGQQGTLEIGRFVGFTAELSDFHWSIAARLSKSEIDGVEEMFAPLQTPLSQLSGLWLGLEAFNTSLNLNDMSADYMSVGGRYDFTNISVVGELTHIKGNSLIFDKVNNGYVTTSYRHQDMEYFVSYSFANSNTPSVNISDNLAVPIEYLPMQTQMAIQGMEPQINRSLAFFSPNQKTLSVGGKWNFSENIVFKLQLNHSKIDGNGYTLWTIKPNENGVLPDTEDHSVNTVLVNMSFAF